MLDNHPPPPRDGPLPSSSPILPTIEPSTHRSYRRASSETKLRKSSRSQIFGWLTGDPISRHSLPVISPKPPENLAPSPIQPPTSFSPPVSSPSSNPVGFPSNTRSQNVAQNSHEGTDRTREREAAERKAEEDLREAIRLSKLEAESDDEFEKILNQSKQEFEAEQDSLRQNLENEEAALMQALQLSADEIDDYTQNSKAQRRLDLQREKEQLEIALALSMEENYVRRMNTIRVGEASTSRVRIQSQRPLQVRPQDLNSPSIITPNIEAREEPPPPPYTPYEESPLTTPTVLPISSPAIPNSSNNGSMLCQSPVELPTQVQSFAIIPSEATNVRRFDLPHSHFLIPQAEAISQSFIPTEIPVAFRQRESHITYVSPSSRNETQLSYGSHQMRHSVSNMHDISAHHMVEDTIQHDEMEKENVPSAFMASTVDESDPGPPPILDEFRPTLSPPPSTPPPVRPLNSTAAMYTTVETPVPPPKRIPPRPPSRKSKPSLSSPPPIPPKRTNPPSRPLPMDPESPTQTGVEPIPPPEVPPKVPVLLDVEEEHAIEAIETSDPFGDGQAEDLQHQEDNEMNEEVVSVLQDKGKARELPRLSLDHARSSINSTWQEPSITSPFEIPLAESGRSSFSTIGDGSSASSSLELEVLRPAHPPRAPIALPPLTTDMLSPNTADSLVVLSPADAPIAGEDILNGIKFGYSSRSEGDGQFDGEGSLPSVIPLSFLEKNTSSFCIEGNSWSLVLRYLTWYGRTRFEATPHDLAKVTTEQPLRVQIYASFWRSSGSGDARVRIRVALLPAPGLPGSGKDEFVPTHQSRKSFYSSHSPLPLHPPMLSFTPSLPIHVKVPNTVQLPMNAGDLGQKLFMIGRVARLTCSGSSRNQSANGKVLKELVTGIEFIRKEKGEPEGDGSDTGLLHKLVKKVKGKDHQQRDSLQPLAEQAALITPFDVDAYEEGAGRETHSVRWEVCDN